jgi:type IV pilus assembly protein PilO
MKLEDLSKLDAQGIANLPWPAKFVAMGVLLLIIVGAGYWFDWQPLLDEKNAEVQKEAELRDVFITKKKQAINLPIYKQQMVDIEKTFGVLLRQLPNKAEVEGLLSDISQAGIGRGLEFEKFTPETKETPAAFYAELPVKIQVTGSFHDLGMFAMDVSKLSRIVTLHEISLTPIGSKDGKSVDRLSMDATAKTYRYLDQGEMASKKKSEKKDKEAKK